MVWCPWLFSHPEGIIMARPTNLTNEVFNKIVALVRAGNFREAAAAKCKVPLRTLYHWLKRGRQEDEGIYAKFLQGVQEAESSAEINMVAVIVRGARQDPNHAKWFLEKKFPKRWGSQSRELRQLQQEVKELRGLLDAYRYAQPGQGAAANPHRHNGHAAAGDH